MDDIEKANQIWSRQNFYPKPSAFYAVYGGQSTFLVTISDNGSIYYFVNESVNKERDKHTHIFTVVSSKCQKRTEGGISYYIILDSPDDVNMGKSAIVPVGCTEAKYNDITRWVIGNIVPIFAKYF